MLFISFFLVYIDTAEAGIITHHVNNYYFNDYDDSNTSGDWIDIDYITDSDPTVSTHGTTDGLSYYIYLNSSNYTSASGIIKYVTLSVNAKESSGDGEPIALMPVYNGYDGTMQEFPLTSSQTWYTINVTTGKNAPLTWTWGNINTLDAYVLLNNTGDDDVYIYQTKINVYYDIDDNPPVLGTPSPVNGSSYMSLAVNWTIPISDPDGDIFNYTIQSSNGQNKSENTTNGSKTLSLSGLTTSTTYTVWVNASDGYHTTRAWYNFSTYDSPTCTLVSPDNNSYASSQTVSLIVDVNNISLKAMVDFYIYYINIFGEWDNVTSNYNHTRYASEGETVYCNISPPCQSYLDVANNGWFVRLMSQSWWDFNDDWVVDGDDILDYYGLMGTPGWFKADLIADGVIDYLDASYFTLYSVPNSISYYPQTGYNWSGDAGIIDPSTDYIWVYHSANNSVPLITITYPVNGSTITEYQWRNNPSVNFTVTDIEGDEMYACLVIFGKYGQINPFYLSHPSPDIDHIVNGSYGFDLSDYITFENMEYNLTLVVYDYGHCAIERVWNTSYSIFEINPAPDLDRHISIKDCYPPDGEGNAYWLLQTGFTWDMCVNISFVSGYPDIWVFLVDDNNAILLYGTRYCTYEPSKTSLWKSYTFGKGYFKTRHTYTIYIGGYINGKPMGHGVPVRQFTKAQTQLDMLYDDTAETLGSFSWHWGYTVYEGVAYFQNAIYEDETGTCRFYGFKITFSTYPPGEQPTQTDQTLSRYDSTWGSDIVRYMEAQYGLSGLGLIIGLLVVGLFTLIPFFIIKRKAKNVPLPVVSAFTLFGLFFSFGMGFFPLWIFVLPMIITFLFIFYNVRAWMTSHKSAEGEK